MNLEHLQMLVSIVEHGSLSGAARAKRISQPAVTKQVQRLESDIGLTLLVRGPKRQVELTQAGEKVLAFARETLQRFETLQRELTMLKSAGKGTLSLAASTIPGEYVLPGILAAFRVEYPQIAVQMTISDSADVVTRLLDEEADVGFVGSPVRHPNLRLERLTGDSMVLVVPPEHPFAERETVTLEELRAQPLILREEGSGTRRGVEAALAALGLRLPQENVVLTLGSTQAILHAVSQGLGVGFVSARAATQQHKDGYLACVRLAEVDLDRDLYLAYLSQHMGDPIVGHFLGFVRRQYFE